MRIPNFIHSFKCWLIFYWRSETLYNIHSPFLFKLLLYITNEDKTKFPILEKIEAKRIQLKKDQRPIAINDLGAGSRVKVKSLTISDIVKNATSNQAKCLILHKMTIFFDSRKILEFGTNLGIATAYLGAKTAAYSMTSIEGDASLFALAKQNIESLGLQQIQIINTDFDSYIHNNKDSIQNHDFIFIDGNHTYAATLKYFEACYNRAIENQVIVFDDIYWSEGMTKAWNEIIAKLDTGYAVEMNNMGIIINSSQIDFLHHLLFIDRKYKPLSFGFWA